MLAIRATPAVVAAAPALAPAPAAMAATAGAGVGATAAAGATLRTNKGQREQQWGAAVAVTTETAGLPPPSHLIYLFINLASMSGSHPTVSPPLVICKILE